MTKRRNPTSGLQLLVDFGQGGGSHVAIDFFGHVDGVGVLLGKSASVRVYSGGSGCKVTSGVLGRTLRWGSSF